MSPKSWINCAFIVFAAYVVLHIVDGAAFRHKRQKADQRNNVADNSNVDLHQHKSQTSFSEPISKQAYSEISFQKSKQIAPLLDWQNNKVRHTEKVVDIDLSRTQNVSESRDKKELNVQNDFDANDNNGAGDGVGDLEPFQNESKKQAYSKGHPKQELNKHKNVTKSLRQILKFKPQEDRSLADMVSFAKPVDQIRPRTVVIPLKMDDLRPPDHVDGLRMEHDGHLNRDYKKEILLGNHEEFEWEREPKLVGRLKDIFRKADVNHDDFLDLSELKDWIMLNVEQHLQEVVADNRRIFSHLDTNKDDFVTWKEFYFHFLLAKGYDVDNAQQESQDYDTISLDPDEKEKVIRYKFRWAEADEEPQDNRLTFMELMNFRHPEQSKTMLVRMVKDLIENFDRNEDKLITEEEFAMLPPGEVDAVNMGGDQEWLLERKREFHEVIDLNKDGVVDEAELKVYVDPHNSNHAKLEAENLIHLADQDADSHLTLNEVLENAELFLGSKMVDASRNFHDEF